MNLYEKLVEVRKVVPYLQKDKKGHGFNYVASSDTLGSLKSKMDEVGVLLVPSVERSEISDHTTAKGGHNYFTVLTMQFTWINAEKPEERIVCGWTGQGLDSGEKGVGKAMTYAEKYFMLKFFNIATDQDDPDSFKGKHSLPEMLSDEQIAKIKDFLKSDKCSEPDLLTWAKVERVEDIPADKYNMALAGLAKRVAA